MKTIYSSYFLIFLLTFSIEYVQSQTIYNDFGREKHSHELPAPEDEFYRHVIQLNGRSHPVDPRHNNSEYMLRCYGGNNALFEEKLDEMCKDIKAQSRGKKIKVMLFAHGGLNGTGSAVEKAYQDYLDIKEYNKHLKNNDSIIYPIFCNWNTGAFSSLVQHYSVIRNGERISRSGGLFIKGTRAVGLFISGPFMAAVDLATGALKIPLYYGEGFWGSRDGMLKNNRKYLASYYKEATNLGIDVNDTVAGKPLDFSGRVLSNKTLFVSAQLTGGITYPLVNGWGTSAWKNMSRRVMCMYRNNEQFYKEKLSNDCLRESSSTYSNKDYNDDLNGPMALLFKKLLKFASDNVDIEINLDFIGHSMGTMVWNEGFRLFGDTLLSVKNIHINNIVYMGAACRIKDWETSVCDILKLSPQTQFFNLSLHPKREKQELFSPIFVPPGSLLEWVDRLYEGPASFEDRTLGKYENVLTVTSMLNTSFKKQIHIKCFGYAYTKSQIKNTPVKHGGFRSKQYWRPEFWR